MLSPYLEPALAQSSAHELRRIAKTKPKPETVHEIGDISALRREELERAEAKMNASFNRAVTP